MIIYKKQLQKIFGFDIEKYKKISGKYKIGEKNGKWREYLKNNNLIFEGQYLNGKRWNGKGYNKNECIKFEIKNGNGKEYNKKGDMEFEIKNGKGNIKEYTDNDKLEYEGEYLNGERNGKGKEYYNDGNLKFEGEYLNGKRWNGKGKEYYNNGKLKY